MKKLCVYLTLIVLGALFGVPKAMANVTVYFQVSEGWENPGVHYFDFEGVSNSSSPQAMTLVSGDIYTYEIPGTLKDGSGIIFANKSSWGNGQTVNINEVVDGHLYKLGNKKADGQYEVTHEAYNGGGDDITSKTIYLQLNGQWSGKTPTVYVWGSNPSGHTNTWPGEDMTYVKDDIWKFTFIDYEPVNWKFVYNGFSGDGNPYTVFGSLDGDNKLFKKTSETETEDTGTTYTEGNTPQPTATTYTFYAKDEAGWGSMHVHAWDFGNGTQDILMTPLGSNYYKVEITGTSKGKLIFQKAKDDWTNRTANIEDDNKVVNGALYTIKSDKSYTTTEEFDPNSIPAVETITFYLDIASSSMADSRSWANCYVRNMTSGTMLPMTGVEGSTNMYKVTVEKSNDKYAFNRVSTWTAGGEGSKYNRSEEFTPEDGQIYSLYIDGGNWHYSIFKEGTLSEEFTPGDDLWLYGTAFGTQSPVKMTYLSDNHYVAETALVGQGTFKITRIKGNTAVVNLISAKGSSAYTVPAAANASSSQGKVALFGTAGSNFVSNAVSVGGTVHFIYNEDADLCQIYYAKEEVDYNIGYSVISAEWSWRKPAEAGKMTVDTSVQAPEGTTVYSVRVNHLPAGNKEWSFMSYDIDNPNLTSRHQEYRISGVTYTNHKFTPAADTKYTLINSEGGDNLVSPNTTTPATIYLSVASDGTKQVWFVYDEVWQEGVAGNYYIRGTILGGWGSTDYAYFGSVNGTKYYGARNSDGVFGPSDYAIRTNLDQPSGDLRWRPFLSNADGDWYMTIDVPATGVNVANATWEYGYREKAWVGRHNGGTLKTNDAYGVSSYGDNMNKFDASSFQAGKTYLFLFTEGTDNNGTLTVREWTNSDRRSYPKFNDTPMEGRWDDENDNHEPLEVQFVTSQYEGVYVYDFAPDKYYEIQFTNTSGEPEMHHFNVSDKGGDKFWEGDNRRWDHTPIGDDNTLDLVDGTPLSFKEQGGVGQNFLLTGPAKVYFRHLDEPEANGATGYMWVEPYEGVESDYEAVFTFWDKGGDKWTLPTSYSKWWDNKPTASRKVEIYAKNNATAPKQIILGGENSQTARLDGDGQSLGKNRGFSVKLRQDLLTAIDYYTATDDSEDVVRDAKGKPVLNVHDNNQPIGLWVRIYKDYLAEPDAYLDRPYAYNAVYTQNPEEDNPLFNVYPTEFKPGNPHVEFTASAEAIEIEGVEADNQLNPGGLNSDKVKYPYVNEYSLEASLNTHKMQDGDPHTTSFPFIPTKEGDDRYVYEGQHICTNGIAHKIYTVNDADKASIWEKLNTVSVRYMGNNHPEVTKSGEVGMGTLKGFSPRYAKDNDALTVAVRYTSPGMIFTRTQSQNIKAATKELLASAENIKLYADDDDLHEALFFGDNFDKDGNYIHKDVLDMIIYNETVIETQEGKDLHEYFVIPGSVTDENPDGKIFAAYIGYTVNVERPEDGDPETIHEFTPYYWNAYNQGVPVTERIAPLVDIIKENKRTSAPGENWANVPIHDDETWHILTNPFGRTDKPEEEMVNKYIYDHNSLAVHIHHLYCQDNNNLDPNEKVEFDNVDIPVKITYEVYLPVLHNLRYIRPTEDEDPLNPYYPENGPENARRRGKARAGISTQADGETPEVVLGTPSDNAISRYTYATSVNARDVDYNATITSISNVQVDYSDAPVEYYTIQGVRVNAENLTPGIYIRRQGNKATKVAIR